MRTAIFLSILFISFSIAMPSGAGTTRHKYNMGTVTYFDNNQIVIESGTYTLMRNIKVIRIVKESNGAHYERKGSLSDVGVGRVVNLKTVGSMVSEIVVER